MTEKDNRFWNIAGTLIILLWLLGIVFTIGKAVGSRPEENERRAADSLTHALEVIDAVDVEDVDDVCESFDTVMDDIHDALAWMGETE